MTDAALRDLAARAASGDGTAREAVTGQARAQAREILAQDRFREGHHHEGLLHGVFVTLGDWLESLTGGTATGWLLLIVVTIAAVAGVATVAVNAVTARRRRRAAGRVAGPGDVPDAAQLGPAELERRALAAEQAGDLDAAIRLRFAAGLLRLDAIHAIDLRPSLTSGAIGRTLRSPRYDDLATTHDAIAYGGRHAAGEDATTAREEWPMVVGEARRR